MKKERIIRVLLFVISAIVMIIYLLPVFFNGIFNIGTLFGVTVNGLIISVNVFWEKIKLLRVNKVYNILFKGATSVFMIFLLAFALTGIYVLTGTIDNADEQGVVIVLGCKVNGTNPSRHLRQRTMKAIKYLNEHPGAIAIVSGGQGEDEGISEAQCMYNIMIENGIAENRIYKEDKSTTTRENMKFSKTIIEENNLSKDVVIVTNDYHERRATITARKAGLNPYRYSAYSDLSPVFYTREVFGLWAQLIMNV